MHCALIAPLCLAGWLGGIVTEAHADLLVSNFVTDQVKRYNETTGAFVDNFASGGGLDGPTGLVFGPDGNLYVSSRVTDEVKRYDGTTGAFIDDFVTSGSGGLDGPGGLVFGPDENLYVISSGIGGMVKRYNGTTGAFIDDFTSGGGLGEPISLVFGPDGNLYVGTYLLRVNRYDGTTGIFIDVFAGGMDEATGVVFGPDENLYVSSSFTGEVKRFDGTGAFIDDFVTSGSGGLNSPGGLLFGRDGNLYVGEGGAGAVLRYNGLTGAFIDQFVTTGSGDLSGATFLVLSPNTAPDASLACPSTDCVWPPNQKFVPITIKCVTDAEGDPITIVVTSITSDEPTSTIKGAGGAVKHVPDAYGVGTSKAYLRAERSGTGDGRVYEITFSASDGQASSIGKVRVKVPRDQRQKSCAAVNSGQIYDATQKN